MLGRYLSAVVIGLLISAWLAVAAFGFFYVRNARTLADGVASSTNTYAQVFREADETQVSAEGFPRGRVFATVRDEWSDTGNPGRYPNGLLATPTRSGAVTRPRGTVQPGRPVFRRRG